MPQNIHKQIISHLSVVGKLPVLMKDEHRVRYWDSSIMHDDAAIEVFLYGDDGTVAKVRIDLIGNSSYEILDVCHDSLSAAEGVPTVVVVLEVQGFVVDPSHPHLVVVPVGPGGDHLVDVSILVLEVEYQLRAVHIIQRNLGQSIRSLSPLAEHVLGRLEVFSSWLDLDRVLAIPTVKNIFTSRKLMKSMLSSIHFVSLVRGSRNSPPNTKCSWRNLWAKLSLAEPKAELKKVKKQGKEMRRKE